MSWDNLIDYKVLEQIRRDYFPPDLSVEIEVELEGMTCRDNRYVLGARAGPQLRETNLLHEMGHLAEREIEKLLRFPRRSWGYTFGREVEILGRVHVEAQTDQAARREMRVWAYQYNLQQKYGIKDSIYETTSAAHYIDAFIHYHYWIDEQNRISREQEDRLRMFAEETLHLSKTEFTLEAFDRNWFEKLNRLKKVLDSPAEPAKLTS